MKAYRPKRKRRQSQTTHGRTLTFEGCEARRLMAGDLSDISHDFSNPSSDASDAVPVFYQLGTINHSFTGAVEITGTESGDDATVSNLPSIVDPITGEVTDRILVEVDSVFGRVSESFDRADVGRVVFYGEAGADNFQNLTDIPSEAYGGEGNDTLVGGSADDKLHGQRGNDLLDGNDGDDELEGGRDADEIKGGRGADILSGNGGDDDLFGNRGADYLDGGPGSDFLEGGFGDDVLYGGVGTDTLDGGGGSDSLLGGADVDDLTGGSDPDRFLLPTTEQDLAGVVAHYPEDTVNDVRSDDATLYFSDADSQWVDLLNEDFWYSEGSWTDQEILAIDEALAELMGVTGNNALLQTSDGDPITFYRAGDEFVLQDFVPVPSSSYAGWNSNDGTITITNSVFDSDGDGLLDSGHEWIHQVVYHEIAHNWDSASENPFWSEWLNESGWTQSLLDASLNGPFLTSGDGNWYYDLEAEFVRNYGRTNPHDDFATTFAFYMMDVTGEDYSGADSDRVTEEALSEKLAIVDDLVTSLV